MSFDRVSQEGKDIAALLAASFDHRQHGLDEATAAGALRPKGELPPNRRMTHPPPARVCRLFAPFVTQEHPQPLAMFVQFPARAAHVGIATLAATQQQTLHLATDGSHPTNTRRARNLSGSTVGHSHE